MVKTTVLGFAAAALLASVADAFVPTSPMLALRSVAGVCRAQTSLRSGRVAPSMAMEVDQPAPDFDLPSDSGSNVSLKSLAGKWIVLYFYPKADSAGCTTQAKNYQADVEDYRGTGAEVIGISTDPVDALQSFKAKYGLTFSLLSDKDGKVAEAYQSTIKLPFLGTFANRNTFIIDPQGVLRQEYNKVDPKMDSIVAFARLKELQNPK